MVAKYIYTICLQQKHNIHCFDDKDLGQWMPIPIGWEIHHEMVCEKVDEVEKELPEWGDRHDILVLLRECNYDHLECIDTIQRLQDDRE